MGTKANPGAFDCYTNAGEDEPMFVLLARDGSAPGLVRAWARAREALIDAGRKPETDRPMAAEARDCADAMDAWRIQNRPEATLSAEDEEADYAVVEIMGHRRHVGRILEVARFGTTMLRVDVPKAGGFANGFTSHFYSGASIFAVTPTDRATVEKSSRPRTYDQPQLFHSREDDGTGEFDDREEG